MNEEKLSYYYQIFLSVFTVVVGALFLFGAAYIYGTGPVTEGTSVYYYSRALVWEKFWWLLIVVALWILAIIGGAVICVAPKKKATNRATPETVYARLKAKLPQEKKEECAEDFNTVARAEKLRKTFTLIGAGICAVCAVMSLIFLCQAKYYPNEQLNAEIIRMVGRIAPWVLIAFFTCVALAIWERVLAKNTLPAVKRILAQTRGEKREEAQVSPKASNAVVLAVRIALALVAVAFIVLGIFNQGAIDVLTKAINICTECIGLG